MVLVIDNYDSFTYNLIQYIQELGAETLCFRNDKVTLDKLRKLKIDRIVISPGPGRPESAGISCDLIGEFYKKIPILGVCLGHQCIGYYFGAKIIKALRIMHGKVSRINHDGKYLFKGIKNPFEATRYHSLIIDRKTLSSNLEVCAWADKDVIMGVRDTKYPLYGVQFHPESIMTHEGKAILKNFLRI